MYSYKAIVILAIAVFLFGASSNRLTVYLIGDSTMASKDVKAFPETGWGMPFANFFDSTVFIDNRAKNGRSTRTFLSESLWQPIADKLKAGDYVLIQFGHNDESKEKVDRYTSPEQYTKNLERFVLDSRSKKAIPVLITPVSRRRFSAGIAQETHAAYSEFVRKTAERLQVSLIDLDKKSRELYQQFGEDKSKLLFLHLDPGENPNYPKGKIDDTHFNELGARKIAQLVLAEIRALNLDLASHIVSTSIKP